MICSPDFIQYAVTHFNSRGHPGCPLPVDISSYVIDGELRPDVYAAMSWPIVLLAFGHNRIAENVLLFSLYPSKVLVKKLLDIFRDSPYRYIKFNALRDRYAAIVRKFGGDSWKQEGRYFYLLDLWGLYEHFA